MSDTTALDSGQLDSFPALSALGFVGHLVTTRLCTPQPTRHINEPRLLRALPLGSPTWKYATQVHGTKTVCVTVSSPDCQPDTDALCTREKGVALAISVADCCPVFIVDTATPAIGLAHSGKKGTEINILSELVSTMKREFGSHEKNLLVQLGPCIRPPHYPIDFAAEICAQAAALDIPRIHDCGYNTASNLIRYYSYRAEKGQTGRMLAALVLK